MTAAFLPSGRRKAAEGANWKAISLAIKSIRIESGTINLLQRKSGKNSVEAECRSNTSEWI